MKNILLAFFLTPVFLFCQNGDLNFNQSQDKQFCKQYKNYSKFDSYTTKDGLLISIGDTLTLGKAFKTKKKYNFSDRFIYIAKGKAKGNDSKDFKFLEHHQGEVKVVVENIFVTHSDDNAYRLWTNRKEMPLYVSIFVKNPEIGLNSGSILSAIGKTSKFTVLDIEKAFEFGEVVNPNKPLSRSEAILKLKESKDLFELDFISEEQYLKLKEKLTPIIMSK